MIPPRRRCRVVRSRRSVWLCLFLGASVAACSGNRTPASPFDTPETAEDARIRGELERRLAAEPALTRAQVRAETRGGVLLLHGVVRGLGEWRCVVANAELTPGVRTVVDYLVLERGPTDLRCLAPRPLPRPG